MRAARSTPISPPSRTRRTWSALVEAMRAALADAGRRPATPSAPLALDTTGSTVIPVGEGLEPLDDYYLWCDHRARARGRTHHRRWRTTMKLPAIDCCGGVYSSEWGFAKLLHWLRHNPAKRGRAGDRARALRHGRGGAVRHHRSRRDAAQRLRDGAQVALEARRTAAFRLTSSCVRSIRCSPASARSCGGRYRTSDHRAGTLTAAWAERLGLAAGIPIPGRRIRRALGRHRRRDRRGRRGQRGRHGDLHHGDREGGRLSARRLRRGARIDPSRLRRHRGGALRHAATCSSRSRSGPDARWQRLSRGLDGVPRRTDRTAAPHLGQRRPHRAGESAPRRRDARLDLNQHRRATSCSRPSRARRCTRASSSSGWRSTACRSAG